MIKRIKIPENIKDIVDLKVGQEVLLSGTIYTARDVAHKKLIELIDSGKPLPFELENSAIYYCGPCPAKNEYPIGPCGPTSSYRMDEYTPKLLELGVKITIGKGKRSDEIVNAISKNGAIYLAATGGAAALIMNCVKSSEVVLFNELGTEAIRKLEVVDFPLIVAVTVDGQSIYN